MYFSNMSLAQEEHTDTGLTDTAADGVWKFFIQNGLLERELSAVVTAGFCKLFVKCCLVYTDTHGRKFKGNVQYRIVYQNIAV